MSHNLELKEGALIISDAHYSSSRPELLKLIQDIQSKKIATPQLLLMGDIFDALFFEVPKTEKNNQQIIKLLKQISLEIDIVYLEGNHDFNLHKIFPDIRVIPIDEQPFLCKYKDKKVALAHGDFDVSFLYGLYSKIIRNSSILNLLNMFNTLLNNVILKNLDNYLDKKDDCNEFVGFKSYIQNRDLEKYGCDYFIEGHYHQNKAFELESMKYINLAAFACNQRYFIVKLSHDKELFIEEHSYKET